MKRISTLFLLIIISLAWGKEHKWDFRKKTGFRVYPPEQSAQWQQNESGSYLIKPTGFNNNLSSYTWIDITEDMGTMNIQLRYKTLTPRQNPAGLQLRLRFREKGNPSNMVSQQQFKLADSKEFQDFKAAVDIPGNAENCQVVLLLEGGEATACFESMNIKLISDQIKIPANAFTGKPSSWRNAGVLDSFYLSADGDEPKAGTQIRMAYTHQNLYIGFIGEEPFMQNIKADEQQKDGKLWLDDCFELFIFSRERNNGWQFVVNAANAKFDAELLQGQAGDPYKSYKQWDGEWQHQVWKNKQSWECVMIIPWKTLGYNSILGQSLYLNFARERKAIPEISQWNAFIGNLNDVSKYAEFLPENTSGLIRRYRKLEARNFIPSRKTPQYAGLLSDTPGNYLVGAWSHGAYPEDFPGVLQKKYSQKDFAEWFDRFMTARGQAHMFGINLPWAANRFGLATLVKYHKTFGTTYPYALFGSALHNSAGKRNPELFINHRFGTDPASDAYIGAALEALEALRDKARKQDYQELIAFIHGIDEPTNHIPIIYSFTHNHEQAEILEKVDREIKKQTGFGKYGIKNTFGSQITTDTPFQRIAFWRYWNNRFNLYLSQTSEKVKTFLPRIQYLALNRNTCSGICELDIALLSSNSEWIGCDPYPTSAAAFFGMGRGIYHTGFSTKMLADLAPSSKICTMPQGFIYHGGRPQPEDIREWTAQSLKNGAEMLFWFVSGPAISTIPDAYNEILNVNRQVAEMNKLMLPTETQTAILYSDYDRWGLDDQAGHAVYSVYSLLGEHLKSWFRFISPSGIAGGLHKLNDYRLIYIPRMRFTDSETTARLMEFMENGGIIVTFDPDFLSFNIDGSIPAEREKLLETKLIRKNNPGIYLTADSNKLPLAKIMNLDLPASGKIDAYDFAALPRNTKILAHYVDGRPAIIEKTVGRGKFIFSAVMPFGSSDTVLASGGWKEFFKETANRIGEKNGLGIWDFELPPVTGKRITLEY